MRINVKITILLVCLFVAIGSRAQKYDRQLLSRVMQWPRTAVANAPDSVASNSYVKLFINIERRNVTLAAIPTLFYLVRDGKRQFLTESYSHTKLKKKEGIDSITSLYDYELTSQRQVYLSTIYHRHRTMPSMIEYVSPQLYSEQMFAFGILSPLCPTNRKFYIYRTVKQAGGRARITFRCRRHNTQLLHSGHFEVDTATGRIRQFVIQGEYDMIRFTLSGHMGHGGVISLLPNDCQIDALFQCTGNRIHMKGSTFYNLPTALPDTLNNVDSYEMMSRLRPVKLSEEEQKVLSAHRPKAAPADTTALDSTRAKPKEHKRSWAKRIFWDILGDNLLNRISTQLGDEGQGQLRIGPIFNPLYFGYSGRKGLYYKFDTRLNYRFSADADIAARLKLGYSFKQHQLFFNLPITWNFRKHRNGYVRLDFGNGNRITNSRVLDAVKAAENADSIDWDKMGLDYFKDMYMRLGVNYDFWPHRIGLQFGVTSHRRTAVDKKGFIEAEKPWRFHTFAPYIQLQWRPLTDRVPLIITAEMEQGVKAFGGDMRYTRFETDAQFVKDLPAMRSLSLRAGFGLYIDKGSNDYFLDYYNFHENYVPGGWSDKWTGEFEMLNSNWYNASDYYVRTNATYTSPLLFLSWLPWVGEIMEQERVYFSSALMRARGVYTEIGYGFTNRVFSMGIFTGFTHNHFEGIEVKFGLELFDNW